MYSLKCNHCGHANALKSEYVTFCASCSKKMANNYSDWKLRNPAGDFASYCEAVGVTVNEAAGGKPVKKKRFYWDRRKVVIGVAAILVSSIAGLLVERSVKMFGGKVPEEWMTREWKPFRTPRGIAEFLIPIELKPFTLTFPPEAAQFLAWAESCQSDSSMPIQVLASELEYRPEVQVSLQGGADGGINAARNKPGISDFDYEEVDVEISGQKAIRQSGKYRVRLFQRCFFRSIYILKEQHLVQVVVIYAAKDAVAEKVAERIINSVKLKNI